MGRAEWAAVAGITFLLLLTVGGAVLVGWYKAGVQQEVYRRQGVEMTRWEVFVGAKPVERAIIDNRGGQK